MKSFMSDDLARWRTVSPEYFFMVMSAPAQSSWRTVTTLSASTASWIGLHQHINNSTRSVIYCHDFHCFETLHITTDINSAVCQRSVSNDTHYWQAPLGVRSTKHRHQSPEWQFWATSIAFFRERLLDFRSCGVVFIHLVRGRPGGLLKFSKGEPVKIFLAPVSAGTTY